MFKIEIILNVNGYSYENLGDLFDDVDTDYILDNELKVALQYYPAAIDFNQIILNIDFIGLLAEAAVTLAVTQGILSLYRLSKNLFKLRDVENKKPIVNANITVNTKKIEINLIEELELSEEDIEVLANLISDKLKTSNEVNLEQSNAKLEVNE